MSIESFTFPAKRGSGDAAPGLERDLGPRNRYDQLAARAQLVGTQYRRPQLLAMGTRLSELTQDIPYSDDRFSKVEAFASEIEKEVAHVTEHATADLESIDQAGEWSCMLQIVRGRHAISAECWRGGTDQGPRTREALRVLRDAVSGSVEKEMTMEFGQGIGGGDTVTTSYGADGEEVSEVVFRIHEAGGWGERQTFYFPDEGGARAVWERVRDIMILQPEGTQETRGS